MAFPASVSSISSSIDGQPRHCHCRPAQSCCICAALPAHNFKAWGGFFRLSLQTGNTGSPALSFSNSMCTICSLNLAEAICESYSWTKQTLQPRPGLQNNLAKLKLGWTKYHLDIRFANCLFRKSVSKGQCREVYFRFCYGWNTFGLPLERKP